MSFSLARLTLYGAISNIDLDLRALAKHQIVQDRPLSEYVPQELATRLKARASSEGITTSEDLFDYLDLGDTLALLQRHKTQLTSTVASFLKRHGQALVDIIPIRNRVMHSRPLQFADLAQVESLLRIIESFAVHLFPNTREYIVATKSDPYFPFSLDVSELQGHKDRVQHNLPIPDFDETGFLGRLDEAKQLLTACKGPWPLITVVGEGGYGKTALALQVAYQLLDDPENPFECIVWTTSKTTRFSIDEVETIQGAISTSLGVLEDIGKTLTGNLSQENLLEEIAEYLNTFRILLIIDNLETVLDKRMIDFFGRLTGKSKILVTSRVGTGVMNYPFSIGALSESDCVQLLRATARARRVPDLATIKSETLRQYCRRMKYNAGFIKWFVSVVQCGKRPEEALANPHIFLDFCLSNVYEHLSDNAKHTARAMMAVPGRHAQPSLSYITGLGGDEFQVALQSLWSANLVTMSNIDTAAGYETIYELHELPRLYMLRHYPPSINELNDFQARKRKIVQMHERLQTENRDPYDPRYIARRSMSDTVLAKYLSEALAASSRSQFEEALDLVERAKRLDPGFFEVHRVEARIHSISGNPSAATASFDTAIACEPKSPQLRYWYGGFLLRYLNEIDLAKSEFREAHQLDPGAIQIALELGRAEMFSGNYAVADEAFEPAVRNESLTMLIRRKAFDSWLQCAYRRLQHLSDQGDYIGAVDALKDQLARYSEFSNLLADERILVTMSKALTTGISLSGNVSQTSLKSTVDDCCAYLSSIQNPPRMMAPSQNKKDAPDELDIGPELAGFVAQYDPFKKFGFIYYSNNKSVFFHYSDVISGQQFIEVGSEVAFKIVRLQDKHRASHVEVRGQPSAPKEQRRSGVIKSILLDKKYGFIFDDLDGAQLFFHEKYMSPGHRFPDCIGGAKVTYSIGQNAKGNVAVDVQLVDS